MGEKVCAAAWRRQHLEDIAGLGRKAVDFAHRQCRTRAIERRRAGDREYVVLGAGGGATEFDGDVALVGQVAGDGQGRRVASADSWGNGAGIGEGAGAEVECATAAYRPARRVLEIGVTGDQRSRPKFNNPVINREPDRGERLAGRIELDGSLIGKTACANRRIGANSTGLRNIDRDARPHNERVACITRVHVTTAGGSAEGYGSSSSQ